MNTAPKNRFYSKDKDMNTLQMQSDELKDLAAALSKAQGEIKAAVKDTTNPHYKSKYADLSSVWEACRAQLSKNGLSVTQGFSHDSGHTLIITTLLHSSGQWIRSILPVDPQQKTPQGMGSAITYMRRYALSAIVGVAPDDDDDGNAASEKPAQRQAATNPQPAAQQALSAQEYKLLVDNIRATQSMDELNDWKNNAKSAWARMSKPQQEGVTSEIKKQETFLVQAPTNQNANGAENV